MAEEQKEDVKTRLQNTSEACIKAYEAWSKDKKNKEAHQELQDAVHDLRKVSSRIEIEMVSSEGIAGGQKPMPIPQNRNANKSRSQGNDGNKSEKPAVKKKTDGDKKDAIKDSLKGGKKPADKPEQDKQENSED